MLNQPKFNAPYERLKFFHNDTPDQALRKAIIIQAITDACSISKSKKIQKTNLEARKWLEESSEEFQRTCLEAGLEPAYVIKSWRTLEKEKMV